MTTTSTARPNAIMVSVDYTDLLGLTLPHNRRHFGRVMVVTSARDHANVLPVVEQCSAEVLATDAFYAGGATFNKWLALEQGLDALGREGWICLMDADVAWPAAAVLPPLLAGHAYAPHRRMFPVVPDRLPPEATWDQFPHSRLNLTLPSHLSGYSMLFHADDPVLGPPPWHQVDWTHAGGADTFFQERWPAGRKHRLPFDVLHLGEPGVNWFGRSNPHADGTRPPHAAYRRQQYLDIWQRRRERQRQGLDPYAEERVGQDQGQDHTGR